MFTTGAHNCQYVFLITNTDPDAPKHKSITMFLVPLDTPGIEIQGIRTVDGDRTNIVYYSDVRVDDKYRLGEVNGGWTVLREPLNAEHGAVAASDDGLPDVPIMMHQGGFMVEPCDSAGQAVGTPDAERAQAIDDDSVAYRLGRSVARMEVAISAPSIFGRVALAQTMRDVSPDLMDILGTASALPVGTEGAADDGAAEYVYRFAPLVGIYGGTLEVFRNMIAQHVLGLGKPNYSPPKKASDDTRRPVDDRATSASSPSRPSRRTPTSNSSAASRGPMTRSAVTSVSCAGSGAPEWPPPTTSTSSWRSSRIVLSTTRCGSMSTSWSASWSPAPTS